MMTAKIFEAIDEQTKTFDPNESKLSNTDGEINRIN